MAKRRTTKKRYEVLDTRGRVLAIITGAAPAADFRAAARSQYGPRAKLRKVTWRR